MALTAVGLRFTRPTRTSTASASRPKTSPVTSSPGSTPRAAGTAQAESSAASQRRNARALLGLDGDEADTRGCEGVVELPALLLVRGEDLDRLRPLRVLLDGRELTHAVGLDVDLVGAGPSDLVL